MKLNIDQKRIIETKPNGHMLIKGVAGSGKTTVAVNKIPHLVNHYCFEKEDKVLVITYTKTLINYIKHIYDNMEEENTLFSFVDIDTDKGKRVIINTVDSLIYRLFKKYEIANNKTYKLIDHSNKYRIINRAIEIVSKKIPDQQIVKSENVRFLLDELDWMKSCKFINIETYQTIDRRGRTSIGDNDGPQRILKNSVNRSAIYELLITYENLIKNEGFTDFKTMAIRVLGMLKKNKDVSEKYTHILIDESQDLTRVQLEILDQLYDSEKRHSSVIFVADTAQSIYTHSWLSYNSFKSIGFDMSGRSKILSKNYRTTTQIAKAAYSLIENDENVTSNINYVRPSVIDRQGEYPYYRHFESEDDEVEFVCNEIKDKLYKKYNLKDIAIITRRNGQIQSLRKSLIDRSIDAEIIDRRKSNFDNDSVKLLTMHSIKGLEFDVVIIMGLNEGIIPIKEYGKLQDEKDLESVERKLLYVGMTRAKEELYLTSSKKQSKFIDEINSQYLRLYGNRVFSKVKHIGVENYMYKDKLIDQYGYEEVVRQWVINELHEKLNYPYELMDIEYKVRSFSKTGYVDIVVFEYDNGKKIPKIFCEVKSQKETITEGIKQLKGYMSTNDEVEYGLVTNGNDIKILKREVNSLTVIERLPEFTGNKGEIVEKYDYIDLRHNKKFKLYRNVEDSDTIDMFDYDSDAAYDIESYHKLDICGDIVAGEMKLAVQEYKGSMPIPTKLLYDEKNCFLLKVTGDSMINIGIDIGDYVVVHNQHYADNLDVVVAVVGEEATLKKYSKMGNRILLVPENKSYEPILVDERDLYINGKVIGVIKKI